MGIKGYEVKRPLNILTEEEVKRIHYAALKVMEKTGVVFHHKKALEILGDAGCDVDKERVRFPNHLIEESLGKCPKNVLLRGRTPEYDVLVGDPYVHFAGGIAMDTLNLETMDRKTPTVQDHINVTKVLDYLDEVHVNSQTYTHIEGVPDILIYSERFKIDVKHTSKPFITAGIFGNEIWAIKMAQVVGENPAGHAQCSPPLTWSEDKINCLFHYIEADFPILPGTGLATGMTSPVTLAGSLVQQLAEILPAIVLAQIVKPGTGVIVKSRIEPADMRTGMIVEGGVEKVIADAAWNQIWRWYQVPRFHDDVGTDSKVPDYQCGMEKALHLLLSALTGSNIIAAIGTVYDEITASPIVAIMDNELVRRVGRIINGVEVNEETLAVDLINEVGPLPGQFLRTAHTRKFWKSELLIPDLDDRLEYSEWVGRGKKTNLDYAKEKYEEILATHKPVPLPEDKRKAIDEIAKEARVYYQKKGML